MSSNSLLIGVSVGQLAFSSAISSWDSTISVPLSESRIELALEAPGMGIAVGNWERCQAIVSAYGETPFCSAIEANEPISPDARRWKLPPPPSGDQGKKAMPYSLHMSMTSAQCW